MEPMAAIQVIAKKGRLTLHEAAWVAHCVSLVGKVLAEWIGYLPAPESIAAGDERATKAKAALIELAVACEELMRTGDHLGSRFDVTIFDLPSAARWRQKAARRGFRRATETTNLRPRCVSPAA